MSAVETTFRYSHGSAALTGGEVAPRIPTVRWVEELGRESLIVAGDTEPEDDETKPADTLTGVQGKGGTRGGQITQRRAQKNLEGSPHRAQCRVTDELDDSGLRQVS